MSKTTYNGKPMPTIDDFCEPKETFHNFEWILFSEKDYIKAKSNTQLKCRCSYCLKDFYRSKGEIAKRIRANKSSMYCSLSCSTSATNKLKRKQPTTLPDYICETCGKLVLGKDTYSSGRFCCRKCANAYSSKFGNTPEKRAQKALSMKKVNSEKVLRPCKRCGQLTECGQLVYNVVCNTCLMNNKSERELYYIQCAFKFSKTLYKYLPGYELLEQYGWYKPIKNNRLGATKDHMVSIYYGWTHNIDPKIISHPANCQIMLLSDNSSKGEKCSITIEQLLKRIEQWENLYGGPDWT